MIKRSTSRKMFLSLMSLVVLFGWHAFAQSTSTPELSTLTQEAVVPFSQIAFTATPAIPPALLQAVQSGALEIRQAASYVAVVPPGTNEGPSSRRLTVRTFVVQPNSPNPTPTTGQGNLIETFEIDVNNVYFSTNPRSVALVGTVASGNSPVGSVAGATAIYAAGYDTGTPTKFNSTIFTIVGVASSYARESTGTLTVVGQQGPGTPGGTNEAPVANAGANSSTVSLQIQLDGSASTDPEGGPLTYAWRSVGKSASIGNANTARPTVQFGEGFGEYTFELTVTDEQGASATARVVIFYAGR
jgi:hypothetical protein